MEGPEKFKTKAEKAVDDIVRQEVFDDNIANYNTSLNIALSQFQNLELARKRAGNIRFKAINSLEKYLIEFESNFEKNGGKLLWALSAEEALDEISSILKKHKTKRIIRSRTLVSDEINLDAFLESENIESVKVSPADWILNRFEEKPRHASSFLIEKSLEQIIDKISDKDGTGFKHNPAGVINFIKNISRTNVEDIHVSISGASYLIADTGSLCISENHGDGILLNAVSGVNIILCGIDKIIPSLSSLDTLIPLYSSFSSGDRINAFNSIISGPRAENETDGPSELYVILLDNGRSEVLAQKHQRRALGCIDCGACQNVCPVYRKIGGDTFDTTYTGPIGSVLNPWMNGMEEYIHQSYASTLCGHCTEICPVNINIHQQLLYNRNDSIRMKNYSSGEKMTMEAWHLVLSNRKWMDKSNAKWKNIFLKKIYADKWGKQRTFPKISEKSFKQLWEERREGKN
ncbi:MAG TPA: LUD domain-containing protein [Lentimicrobium sp.]|nr:LUD domain-containing protein [Lentimicrobium sp.]